MVSRYNPQGTSLHYLTRGYHRGANTWRSILPGFSSTTSRWSGGGTEEPSWLMPHISVSKSTSLVMIIKSQQPLLEPPEWTGPHRNRSCQAGIGGGSPITLVALLCRSISWPEPSVPQGQTNTDSSRRSSADSGAALWRSLNELVDRQANTARLVLVSKRWNAETGVHARARNWKADDCRIARWTMGISLQYAWWMVRAAGAATAMSWTTVRPGFPAFYWCKGSLAGRLKHREVILATVVVRWGWSVTGLSSGFREATVQSLSSNVRGNGTDR